MLLSRGGSSGESNGRLTPSPWLLFGVLAFVDKHLGNVSGDAGLVTSSR